MINLIILFSLFTLCNIHASTPFSTYQQPNIYQLSPAIPGPYQQPMIACLSVPATPFPSEQSPLIVVVPYCYQTTIPAIPAIPYIPATLPSQQIICQQASAAQYPQPIQLQAQSSQEELWQIEVARDPLLNQFYYNFLNLPHEIQLQIALYRSASGITALHVIPKTEYAIPILYKLADLGAFEKHIKTYDSQGKTPLHIATLRTYKILNTFLTILAQKNLLPGCINTPTKKARETPLVFLLQRNRDRRRDVITLLVTHGARLTQSNAHGLNAISFLNSSENSGFLQELKALSPYQDIE